VFSFSRWAQNRAKKPGSAGRRDRPAPDSRGRDRTVDARPCGPTTTSPRPREAEAGLAKPEILGRTVARGRRAASDAVRRPIGKKTSTSAAPVSRFERPLDDGRRRPSRGARSRPRAVALLSTNGAEGRSHSRDSVDGRSVPGPFPVGQQAEAGGIKRPRRLKAALRSCGFRPRVVRRAIRQAVIPGKTPRTATGAVFVVPEAGQSPTMGPLYFAPPPFPSEIFGVFLPLRNSRRASARRRAVAVRGRVPVIRRKAKPGARHPILRRLEVPPRGAAAQPGATRASAAGGTRPGSRRPPASGRRLRGERQTHRGHFTRRESRPAPNAGGASCRTGVGLGRASRSEGLSGRSTRPSRRSPASSFVSTRITCHFGLQRFG
jgi:hypothetical protein